MSKKTLFIIIALVGFSLPSIAKIEFNKNCLLAFENITKLKIPKAEEILSLEIEKNPQNAFAYYLQGYAEIITVFINEESQSYKKLQKSLPEKIKKIEKYGGKSPYTQFFKGQLLFYYGLTQAKFDEFLSAGSNMKDSYNLLKNNATKYPKFLPNHTILGVIETFSGTVPSSFKWLLNIFGIKASIQNGMNRLEKIANAKIDDNSEIKYFKLEANFFLGGLYHLVLHKEEKGWNLINNLTSDYSTNLFSNYLRSSFLIKTGKNEEAIEVLTHQPSGKDFADLKFLDYLLGVGKLSRLDKDADKYLIRFINDFKGRNYIKSALQKLAWYYLINGDIENYKIYMAKISKMGYEFTDEDKQAAKNSKELYIPNVSLLRARLLFDGGYYTRSYKELEGKSNKNYTEIRDQVEFIYRLARIYQKEDKDEMAISYFTKTINGGKNLPQYYAMASSLEIASIYELNLDLINAKKYYEKALTFTKNKEYVNSLEQRAKAGIDRVKTK